MLQSCAGLGERELAALGELERRVVAADGGRLKLEWATLRSRPGGAVEDLLFWADDDAALLVGFAGMYSFGGMPLEIAGMVDPSYRRRGIGSVLLEDALGLARTRGLDRALLVCPRTPAGGAEFARSRGGILDRSEHALVLAGDPADGASDPSIDLRAATTDEAPAVAALLESGFGYPPGDVVEQLSTDPARQLVVLHGGAVVGFVRLSLHEGAGGVYGFVIDAAMRGRGIGRDVLRRCCRMLRADGAISIGLEVESDNDHALGLYTSLGFRPVTTEDYFAVPVT